MNTNSLAAATVAYNVPNLLATAIALIIILNTSVAWVNALGDTACAAPSTKLHSKQVLLSRKKRYIFFTPGSAATATMAITKSLASGFPRGVNTIYEADLSFPLPTKITDWYPKPRKTVAVKMSKIDNDIDEDDAALDDGGGDDSLTMNNNETSLRPNDYWHRSPIYIHTPSSPSFPASYSPSASASITRLRPVPSAYAADTPTRPRPLNETQPRRRHHHEYTDPRPAVRPHSRPNNVAATSDRYYRRPTSTRWMETMDDAERMRQQQPVSYTEWRHRGGYRERRDLFTKFESVAAEHGFDIHACLLRMICEARHYLLPRGKSFFHDMLRILFYIPTTSTATKSEAYAAAMRSTLADCITGYRRQCPYSVLGMLLSRQKNPFG